MSWNRELFIYKSDDKEREELRELIEKRNSQLKESGINWKTIITEDEMADRKRLGMSCKEYITIGDFKKKVMLENSDFIWQKKTKQQEIDDKDFFKEKEKE